MDTSTAGNEPAPLDTRIPEARRSRFCGKCGTALPEGSDECPACAHARTQPSAATGRTYSAEIREVKSALWLYFSMFAVSLCVIAISLASGPKVSLGLEVFGSIAMTLVISVWAVVRRDTLLGLLSLKAGRAWYGLALICPVVTFILASLCVHLAGRLVNLKTIESLEPFTQAGVSAAWAVLLVCVQPAIFEEIAFRGVIQGTLQTIVGPWQAILASAALFAVLHLSVVSIPHLAFMGLVLAWLRMSSGSIYPGMVVHFLHNLLCLIDEKSGGILPWS